MMVPYDGIDVNSGCGALVIDDSPISHSMTNDSSATVMTRNKLDKCGSPYNNNMSAGMSAFKFLFICTTVYFIVISILGAIVNANDKDDDPYNTTEDENNIVAVALVQDIIQLIFFIFVLVLMIRTRSYIRSKYAIPAQCCSGNCEGCEGKQFFARVCTCPFLVSHAAHTRFSHRLLLQLLVCSLHRMSGKETGPLVYQ